MVDLFRGDGAAADSCRPGRFLTRRGAGAAGLLAILVLAAGGPVSQAAGAKVSGPKRVTPGKRVVFRASGFAPEERLRVLLQPTLYRGGNGFFAHPHKRFRTGHRGKAKLRFRWPRRSPACVDGDCSWPPGSKVDVTVCGVTSLTCTRRVVRIRR